MGDAVRDLGITYPVALDPDFATWDAFGDALLADDLPDRPRGHVRDLHVGEGDEARTEDLLRRALGVPAGEPLAGEAGEAPPDDPGVTPETWVGAARIRRLAPGQRVRPLLPTRYEAPEALAPDSVAFDGEWTLDDESAEAGGRAAIELAFRAKGVYLVLDGGGGGRDPPGAGADRRPGAHRPTRRGRTSAPAGRLAVDVAAGSTGSWSSRGPPTGRIRIELAPGTRAFAFTFG